MKVIKKKLQAIIADLKALSKKTDALKKAIETAEKKAAAKPARKAPAKKAVNKKAVTKKASAKKAAAPAAEATATETVAEQAPAKKAAPKRKAAKSTDADTVVALIKRHKAGIDVRAIKKKTGFNDKKISNIVHRASKKGLIKRSGRGIYVTA